MKHQEKYHLTHTLISLVLTVVLCFGSIDVVWGETSGNGLLQDQKVTSITSGNPGSGEYLELITVDNRINVKLIHSQGFDRIVLRLMKDGERLEKDGDKSYYDKYYTEGAGANSIFQQDYDFSEVPDGTYYLRVVVQYDKNTQLTNYPSYLDGVKVVVSGGIPSLYEYGNVKAGNLEKTSISSSAYYKQTTLDDYKYQLFSKKGTKSNPRTINSSEAAYYKAVADKIVSASDPQYTKLKKIYVYVAKNFYYDHYANVKKRVPYDDPYYNLMYFEKKTGNSYNASAGKVAVQCDGYAGVFVALARSQGIPCRIIYGHRVSAGSTSWESQNSSISKSNHTWAQAWVNGQWINIDPQQGSYNDYATDGTWKKSNLVNYTYFDVSDTLLAYSHYALSVPGGNTAVSLMNVPNEISQMKTFLSFNGNGKKLNSKYSASNKATWGTGATFYTDGFGSVKYINWPKKNLKGALNLKDFKNLKNLTVYVNKLTSMTTTGCASLESVYASGNTIKKVDLKDSKVLKVADYRTNPLTSVQLYINAKNRSFTAGSNGTFGFKYEKAKTKNMTLYAKADIGYKYLGLYNSAGKRVSTKTMYQFKPGSAKYTLKFKLDPNSYKYFLRQGNKSSLKPYNLAVQKRLKALGYYKGTLHGKYNSTTTKAVKAFQKKNNLKKTGKVDKKTWKKLFSSKAKKK